MLGKTLFVRNSEWLAGTIPALCLALGGSNSNVQPNDLLPIIAATHEDGVCSNRCWKKASVTKMIRQLQRTQATTNGYFGGYISKRQPVGHFETKKCVDKMYTLRAKQQGATEAQAQRAV